MISGMTSVALVVDIPGTSRITRFRISYGGHTSLFAKVFKAGVPEKLLHKR
jgi:hypothetical protein